MTAALHEQFVRQYEVEGSSNRRFGWVVGGLLLLFGCVRMYLHGIGPFSGALASAGLILAAAAALRPEILGPANRAWAKLGLLLHKITNPVFLGLMFGGAIVPTGLIMRAFGADPMGQRRRDQETYWRKRNATGSTVKSLEQPF